MMKLLICIWLVLGLVLGLVFVVDSAFAQNMTDSIQMGRMTVLEVNKEAGKIYCLEPDGRLRVVEFQNGPVPLIVRDRVQRADLSLLSVGDVIKVYRARDGRAQKIMVLRRASEEMASPEQ